MTTLADIEIKTRLYDAARQRLIKSLSKYNAAVAAVKEEHLPTIKAALDDAQQFHEGLVDDVDSNRHLFKKPKTRVFHGFKVGLQKKKGALNFADPEKTIELIKKHFPRKKKELINTVEKLVKGTIEKLTGKELKSIGATLDKDTDAVYIKSTDKEVDKIMSAMVGTDVDIKDILL